tara:strand:+ start:1824 stop:2273 length:450 start_codon:yes stop_codon:yes gene_type:complete
MSIEIEAKEITNIINNIPEEHKKLVVEVFQRVVRAQENDLLVRTDQQCNDISECFECITDEVAGDYEDLAVTILNLLNFSELLSNTFEPIGTDYLQVVPRRAYELCMSGVNVFVGDALYNINNPEADDIEDFTLPHHFVVDIDGHLDLD